MQGQARSSRTLQKLEALGSALLLLALLHSRQRNGLLLVRPVQSSYIDTGRALPRRAVDE